MLQDRSYKTASSYFINQKIFLLSPSTLSEGVWKDIQHDGQFQACFHGRELTQPQPCYLTIHEQPTPVSRGLGNMCSKPKTWPQEDSKHQLWPAAAPSTSVPSQGLPSSSRRVPRKNSLNSTITLSPHLQPAEGWQKTLGERDGNHLHSGREQLIGCDHLVFLWQLHFPLENLRCVTVENLARSHTRKPHLQMSSLGQSKMKDLPWETEFTSALIWPKHSLQIWAPTQAIILE